MQAASSLSYKKTKWRTELPEDLACPIPPSNGAAFVGRGRVISGRLANRFGNLFATNTKLLRGVIGPESAPNEYLNTVFDDVVSLCGSCRNNTLPVFTASIYSTKIDLVRFYKSRTTIIFGISS